MVWCIWMQVDWWLTSAVWQQHHGGAVYSSGAYSHIAQSTFTDCRSTNTEAVSQHMACTQPSGTRVGETACAACELEGLVGVSAHVQ